MLKNITTNKALGFTDNQWGQLIEANGLLLMWFIEWNQVNDAVNKDKEKPLSIMDFFKQKYNMSAGGDPWDMKGKVSLDGKYVSENSYDDDEDLEFYAKLEGIDTTAIAKLQGEDMSIVGYKSRARKNKWILQRLRDGAEFVCNDHVAKQFFKKREEITQ